MINGFCKDKPVVIVRKSCCNIQNKHHVKVIFILFYSDVRVRFNLLKLCDFLIDLSKNCWKFRIDFQTYKFLFYACHAFQYHIDQICNNEQRGV